MLLWSNRMLYSLAWARVTTTTTANISMATLHRRHMLLVFTREPTCMRCISNIYFKWTATRCASHIRIPARQSHKVVQRWMRKENSKQKTHGTSTKKTRVDEGGQNVEQMFTHQTNKQSVAVAAAAGAIASASYGTWCHVRCEEKLRINCKNTRIKSVLLLLPYMWGMKLLLSLLHSCQHPALRISEGLNDATYGLHSEKHDSSDAV